MIHYVKIKNHLGETKTIELKSPEKSGLYIQDITGLGPSKSSVNLSDVLSLDGSFYNSSRVNSRNIVMTLGFYDNMELYSVESIRQQTYRLFPPKRALEIEVETDNRLVYTTGYVESNEPNIFSKTENTVISLICPGAFFYGRSTIATPFSGSNAGFEFPFENPSLTLPLIEFGSVFYGTTKSVFYIGDEETGVTIDITINGAVNNLTLQNTTKGQTMAIDSVKLTALTGSNLVSGDRIIINTIRGSKSITLIRGGVSTNILNTLGTNTTWFTIDRGDNFFTYSAQSGVGNVVVVISHQLVYDGV